MTKILTQVSEETTKPGFCFKCALVRDAGRFS